MKTYNDFDLTLYNSYRIKAVATRVFVPEFPEDIQQIFTDSSRKKVVVGGGCNIILSKAYYEDVDFVIFKDNFSSFNVRGNTIRAQSGLCLKKLSEIACDHGLSGLEIFYDIPGTLGGAVCMNAGAKDECIGHLTEQVTYFDRSEKAFKTIQREAIGFGYRTSFFLERPDVLIAEVRLCLCPGDKDAIRKKMIDNQIERRNKQPWELPNAGSVFKRPPGRFVGQIIDQMGLKGKTIGGAQISDKHGGFIVNYNGQATGQDVVDLIRFIQETVFEKLQVKLELEQRII